MKKSLIFFAAFLLLGLFAIPAFAGPFTDVPTDHWAYEAIDKLQSEGFVEGYPDGTFKGNRAFTRYEMAMVVARLWDRLEGMSHSPKMPTGNFVTEADLEEYKDMVDNLMREFEGEIARLRGDVNKAHNRLDDVEKRLGALERVRKTIEWSGMMRVRIESIITDNSDVYAGGSWDGYYEGFWDDIESQINERCPDTRGGTITPIVGGFGTSPGQGVSDPELEQLIYLALSAKPADYLDVYVSLLQIASFLDTPYGSGPSGDLWIDEAWMDADLMTLLGWEAGEVFNRFHMIFGRIYGRVGEYGLAFDNGFASNPGFFWDLGGDRLDIQLYLMQAAGGPSGEGVGVLRTAYGFGDSRSTRLERDYFAKVGVNLLPSGIGDEDGFGIDLNTEILPNDWFSLLRFEYFYMNQDQLGLDVEDWYGDDYANNFIVGVDVYNNGNLKANLAYADIGLVPGLTSVDNDPFEEFDTLWNGIGANFNWGYESGINMFPANFEGIGVDLEYTWFEKLYSHLAVFDGSTQADDDLPVVLRLNLRYPLSESSDIALEYIHAGIDYDTIAKLRGEFLVRF